MTCPASRKDEIQVHLENGYLTVSAEKHADKQAGKGKYLRQERYSGTVSRTFYVGDALNPMMSRQNMRTVFW